MVPDRGRRLLRLRAEAGGQADHQRRARREPQAPRAPLPGLLATYWDPGRPPCEHAKCHRAPETEERVAAFVLGLMRDPETLRGEAERQAEGERRRLGRAGLEAERLMDLALDGPFGRDETREGPPP